MSTEDSLAETQQSDQITLYEQEDGLRSMKLGEHDDVFYIDDNDELATREAVSVAKLDEPITEDELTDMDADDLPKIVNEFFDNEDWENDN